MGRDALLEQVRARRRARVGMTAFEAEQACGIAPHNLFFGLTLGLANKSLRAATDELVGPKFILVRDRCVAAALDGHELASAVRGGPDGPGKAFSRANDASRFAARASASGSALLAGPHASIARSLVDDHLEGVPDPLRPVAERALANALAGGVLLHVYEHGPAAEFAGLAPKPAARKPKAPPPQTAPEAPDLLAKVFAAPDDDEPRLVYADWLTEHGDPRGEFILIQCALGRAIHGAGAKYVSRVGRKLPFEARQDLEAREKALLKAHEREWVAAIRPFVRFWGFQRGFVHEVKADVAAFLDGLPALRSVPLTSAKLTGFVPRLAARFASAEPHPTLRTLDLSRNRLDARALEMFGSAFFAPIREFDLWGNRFGDAGLEVLAQATLPSLVSLRLGRVDGMDRGLAALAQAPFWPALERLDASWNELGAETVARLQARFGPMPRQ